MRGICLALCSRTGLDARAVCWRKETCHCAATKFVCFLGAYIIHVDVEAAEVGKHKSVYFGIVGGVKQI